MLQIGTGVTVYGNSGIVSATSFQGDGANLKNLPPWKQEQNWLSIMEGLHHKEAKLITAVKDRQLLKLYPKLEAILKDLGIEDYEKPKGKRKSKSNK